ncbi:uncharacterized protein [Engystomops pustulosus]|uniref:uncharacterized protein isoform X1 n=1 Tax=Engystomops pustulosus TaxID=76066 RepID=UPI003AFAFED3
MSPCYPENSSSQDEVEPQESDEQENSLPRVDPGGKREHQKKKEKVRRKRRTSRESLSLPHQVSSSLKVDLQGKGELAEMSKWTSGPEVPRHGPQSSSSEQSVAIEGRRSSDSPTNTEDSSSKDELQPEDCDPPATPSPTVDQGWGEEEEPPVPSTSSPSRISDTHQRTSNPRVSPPDPQPTPLQSTETNSSRTHLHEVKVFFADNKNDKESLKYMAAGGKSEDLQSVITQV